MERFSTKVQEGGRIVIPASLRKELGLHIGKRVVFKVENQELRVYSPELELRRVQEAIKRTYKPKKGRSIVDEFIAERRREAKREMRKNI